MDSQNSNTPAVRVLDFRGTYKGGGGPDKTILNSAARHDKEKVWIKVCYIKQPQDKEFQIPDLAAQLKINYTDVVDRRLLDWKCILKVRELIKKNGISVIHTHDDKTLLYGYILKRLLPDVRIMHTCHSHPEYKRADFKSSMEFRNFIFRKKIGAFLMKRYDKPILTVSRNTRRRIINSGLQSKDVAVLYNGIDTDYWHPSSVPPVLKKELGLQPDQILIGTVARITYDKDLPTFFKVAKFVSEKHPNVKFAIIGDGYGDELAQAKILANDLGLEDLIHFTGHRTDLREIYASLDIFLMTSITEGLPNTALEAMAMGVPVVSTSVGGIPELVVHGETGLLCPVGNSSALSSAIMHLLENSGRKKQLSQSARQHILRYFNFSNRVKRLEEFYAYFSGSEKNPSFLSPEDLPN